MDNQPKTPEQPQSEPIAQAQAGKPNGHIVTPKPQIGFDPNGTMVITIPVPHVSKALGRGVILEAMDEFVRAWNECQAARGKIIKLNERQGFVAGLRGMFRR